MAGTTLLEHLRLTEVSGVDEPAHAAGSGWALLKAARKPPAGLVVQEFADGGFYVAVEGIEDRFGADHFEQVVATFKTFTKARKAKRSGGLFTRHGGAVHRALR
jgi:hypothetical protein